MAGRPRKSTTVFDDIKDIEEIEKKAKETKPVERKTTVKATVSPWLNVRSAPSASASVLETLKPGADITIYAEKDGFGKISLDEEKWVMLEFVD